VKSVISDPSKFELTDIPPEKYLSHIINIETKFKKALKNLLDNNRINKSEYDKISPIGSKPGILYGLPKVHKPLVDNVPKFRPILSAINTPAYKLAKYLVPILSPLTSNEYTVKDSFSFSKELSTFSSSLYMASLDVESLFTNIPLKETIKNCVNDLFDNTQYQGTLRKNDLLSLLDLATSDSSFIFDKAFYKQIDGVAMGSPLGPTLANAFLCHYEKLWLDKCPLEFKPIVYR